jgi:hypothetical protein
MAITTLLKKVLSYPWDKTNATLEKTWVDAVTAQCNAIVAGEAGFMTADEAGRAIIVDDYFDAATVARVVDAKAIDTGSIADGAIEALQIASDAVTTAKILDANVTQAKIAPSTLDATVVKVGATATGLGAIPVEYYIAVVDGSTVQTGQTLNATYGKTTITDIHFIKGGSTGGSTDAVQLCADSGGTTAVSSSLALNNVAAGGIVRSTACTNNTFAAGAVFYVKRTHTTDCSGTMVIKGFLAA